MGGVAIALSPAPSERLTGSRAAGETDVTAAPAPSVGIKADRSRCRRTKSNLFIAGVSPLMIERSSKPNETLPCPSGPQGWHLPLAEVVAPTRHVGAGGRAPGLMNYSCRAGPEAHYQGPPGWGGACDVTVTDVPALLRVPRRLRAGSGAGAAGGRQELC